MLSDQNVRYNVTRAFTILRGLFKGANNHTTFNKVFDWFFPQHFSIIEKCVSIYVSDDKMIYLIFKFVADLLDNSCNRLRFDTWNVNGLIVFKESANLIINYMQHFECLSPNVKPY
jgi:hypothetical protein